MNAPWGRSLRLIAHPYHNVRRCAVEALGAVATEEVIPVWRRVEASDQGVTAAGAVKDTAAMAIERIEHRQRHRG